MLQIIITVEGGIVQHVEVPSHEVEVVIRDYDVEGVDSDRLEKDDEGEECVVSVWRRVEG